MKSRTNVTEATTEPNVRKRVLTSKLQVLIQIDQLERSEADIGELIWKEGLYSSTVPLWRKPRNDGLFQFIGKKRSPKSTVKPGIPEN